MLIEEETRHKYAASLKKAPATKTLPKESREQSSLIKVQNEDFKREVWNNSKARRNHLCVHLRAKRVRFANY